MTWREWINPNGRPMMGRYYDFKNYRIYIAYRIYILETFFTDGIFDIRHAFHTKVYIDKNGHNQYMQMKEIYKKQLRYCFDQASAHFTNDEMLSYENILTQRIKYYPPILI